MALRQLILNKKIQERSALLTQLRADETKLKDEEVELETALDEAETDEEVKVVEESADELEKKIKDKADEIAKLEDEKAKLETELAEIEDEQTTDEDTDEDEEKTKDGEKRKMGKKVEVRNTQDNKDFANYIRTQGLETRSLNTTSGAVLVPVEVSTNVLELKDGQVDLTAYVTSEVVGTGSGKFPVAKRATAILATKEELADIAEIADPLFIDVEYSAKTRIGQIAFSNELIEDSAIDVVAYAEKQMQRMVRNTNNKGILDVLDTFTVKNAIGADGLKSIVNIELDPELDTKFVVDQNAYQFIDTLKDSQGRYLLQDSIAFDSGKSLFGKEVIVISNAVAPTKPTGAVGFVWAGDLAEAAAYFKRSDITAVWEKFDAFSKGLAVGVRSDYKVVDEKAGVKVKLTAEVAAG
ncbi:phage major capsid protein [Pseudolactococcus raffinolactis]|uniref:phage major capsid protein n=1 Tax=Pseudolactococcus raffinolactis TaxID=1366 RepID=UPI000BB47BB9|nr:phage major capsid protein [Lactococcus raffinolactis]ATC60538.1 phage major capsid protein [Lactococcus raffinolactis]